MLAHNLSLDELVEVEAGLLIVGAPPCLGPTAPRPAGMPSEPRSTASRERWGVHREERRTGVPSARVSGDWL